MSIQPESLSLTSRNTPLVSVVTPTYNRANFLRETLESVLSQNYPRLEYIVLDDGSTDNTRDILKTYAERIIWETHENMGETRTVNKGFKMCHGDYITVVNSDDTLLPDYVSIMVDFMESHPDILVAYPDWIMIDAVSNSIGTYQTLDFNYINSIRWHYSFVQPGAFIRRKTFEFEPERDPTFKYRGDYDYWLRVGLHGPMARVPQVLATWRSHDSGATTAQINETMIKEHIRVIQKFYQRSSLPHELKRVRREAFSNAYYVAAELAIKTHPKLARRYFFYSFMVCPWCWRRYPSGKVRSLKLMLGSIFLPRSFQKRLHSIEKNLLHK